ncbi:MAG: hypothetical protein ABIH21_05330 [Patescibacteria group bacterium]
MSNQIIQLEKYTCSIFLTVFFLFVPFIDSVHAHFMPQANMGGSYHQMQNDGDCQTDKSPVKSCMDHCLGSMHVANTTSLSFTQQSGVKNLIHSDNVLHKPEFQNRTIGFREHKHYYIQKTILLSTQKKE